MARNDNASTIGRPANLPPHLSEIWDEIAPTVRHSIGAVGLEALCGQVYRMRDAQERVTRDGAVVADAKGNPAPHPALAIERAAQAEVLRWVGKYGIR